MAAKSKAKRKPISGGRRPDGERRRLVSRADEETVAPGLKTDNPGDLHPFAPGGSRAWRILASAALGLFALAGSTAAAHADFKVCNNTRSLINLAVGSLSDADYATEGWWTVTPGSCATPFHGPLPGRYLYLYATGIDGVDLLKGTVSMCIDRGKFKLQGIDNCWRRGLQAVNFAEIDTLEFERLDDLPHRTGQVTGSVDGRPWVREGRPIGREGGPRASSKATRYSAGLPTARDIWISSGLRSLASGLREPPVFGRLDCLEFLGFSRTKRAFSMAYARPRGQFIFAAPPPAAGLATAVFDPKTDRPEKLRSGGKCRRSWQATSRRSDRALDRD